MAGQGRSTPHHRTTAVTTYPTETDTASDSPGRRASAWRVAAPPPAHAAGPPARTRGGTGSERERPGDSGRDGVKRGMDAAGAYFSSLETHTHTYTPAPANDPPPSAAAPPVPAAAARGASAAAPLTPPPAAATASRARLSAPARKRKGKTAVKRAFSSGGIWSLVRSVAVPGAPPAAAWTSSRRFAPLSATTPARFFPLAGPSACALLRGCHRGGERETESEHGGPTAHTRSRLAHL